MLLVRCEHRDLAVRLFGVGVLDEGVRGGLGTGWLRAEGGASGGVAGGQGTVGTLRPVLLALLSRYENLYIDLSWSVKDHYLIDDGVPSEEWLALIREFPDRFTLGTDLVGHFDSMERVLGESEPLLEALPPKEAEQPSHGNADALVPKKGAAPLP